METREKSSPDWSVIRGRYEREPHTLRGLAALTGVSHTSIAKRAKSEGWVKFNSANAPCKPPCQPGCKPSLQMNEAKRRALAGAVDDLDHKADSQFHADLLFCLAMIRLEADPDATRRVLDLSRDDFARKFGPAILASQSEQITAAFEELN